MIQTKTVPNDARAQEHLMQASYSVNYSRQQVQSAYLLIFVNMFYLQKHLWAIALCIMMHFCSTTIRK